MTTALFVGRFQPFHKGHEHALRLLFKRFDKVVIAIGSVNRIDRNNPFSFEQRKKMVNAVLKKYRKRYRIIEVPDFPSDKKWAAYISRKTRFDVVVTRNAWTKRCFRGFKIIEQRPFRPDAYSATRIRRLIKDNKNWERVGGCGIAIIDLKTGYNFQELIEFKGKNLADLTEVVKAFNFTLTVPE